MAAECSSTAVHISRLLPVRLHRQTVLREEQLVGGQQRLLDEGWRERGKRSAHRASNAARRLVPHSVGFPARQPRRLLTLKRRAQPRTEAGWARRTLHGTAAFSRSPRVRGGGEEAATHGKARPGCADALRTRLHGGSGGRWCGWPCAPSIVRRAWCVRGVVRLASCAATTHVRRVLFEDMARCAFVCCCGRGQASQFGSAWA